MKKFSCFKGKEFWRRKNNCVSGDSCFLVSRGRDNVWLYFFRRFIVGLVTTFYIIFIERVSSADKANAKPADNKTQNPRNKLFFLNLTGFKWKMSQ